MIPCNINEIPYNDVQNAIWNESETHVQFQTLWATLWHIHLYNEYIKVDDNGYITSELSIKEFNDNLDPNVTDSMKQQRYGRILVHEQTLLQMLQRVITRSPAVSLRYKDATGPFNLLSANDPNKTYAKFCATLNRIDLNNTGETNHHLSANFDSGILIVTNTKNEQPKTKKEAHNISYKRQQKDHKDRYDDKNQSLSIKKPHTDGLVCPSHPKSTNHNADGCYASNLSNILTFFANHKSGREKAEKYYNECVDRWDNEHAKGHLNKTAKRPGPFDYKKCRETVLNMLRCWS